MKCTLTLSVDHGGRKCLFSFSAQCLQNESALVTNTFLACLLQCFTLVNSVYMQFTSLFILTMLSDTALPPYSLFFLLAILKMPKMFIRLLMPSNSTAVYQRTNCINAFLVSVVLFSRISHIHCG